VRFLSEILINWDSVYLSLYRNRAGYSKLKHIEIAIIYYEKPKSIDLKIF